MATEAPRIDATLAKFGLIGVIAVKDDVERISATGKTAESIRFRIYQKDNGNWVLEILGRKYFSTLETGRGPRKSSAYGEFDIHMLEYIKARGIGSGLSEKKQAQLAKFLAYKINKEGDETFKAGGRVVYSDTLTKLVADLKRAIVSDFTKIVISEIVK